MKRAQLELAAELAADAALCGNLELAAPLAVIIDALDAMEADPDLEDTGDLEDGADLERGCWSSGATPDQYRLTYDIGPDLKARSFGVLPPDVPGFERITATLPVGEIERQRALARRLAAGWTPPPRGAASFQLLTIASWCKTVMHQDAKDGLSHAPAHHRRTRRHAGRGPLDNRPSG